MLLLLIKPSYSPIELGSSRLQKKIQKKIYFFLPKVVLLGSATFINEQGQTQQLTWGPKVNSVSSEKPLNTRFSNIFANTNYTMKISAVTRMKKHGKHMVMHCTMPPTTPDKIKLSRFSWHRIEEQGKWMFKLNVPRVSERNGAICCYRY